jgi:F-type H+-transporting ATPase subunit b
VLAAVSVTTTTSSPNFLVPNGTFPIELVIFIVLLGIVAKFILPPIQRAMDARGSAVRAAQEAANEGQYAAEQLSAERREVLEQARQGARQATEQASQEAAQRVEEARRRGLEEHAQRLAEARPGLDAERERLESEVFGRLDVLVIEAAARVLGEPVDPARHAATIDLLIAEARAGAEA